MGVARRRKASRSRIVLVCADGGSVMAVAAALDMSRETVRKRRMRFAAVGYHPKGHAGYFLHMSNRRDDWPRRLRWLAGGIAAVVLAMAIAWVLFVPAADWLARHDVGSAKGPLLQTARDDARGQLLTLGGGLFVAGALAYTARSYSLSREGQVTDRYTKSIEQLGSETLEVRIGGIYALERIARDSARDHPTVMEVLSAFVREHSREQWPPPPAGGRSDARAPEHTTRADVQAAVTVIGRRNPRHDLRPVDLAAVNLTRADLTHATLDHVNLTRANLTDADLTDAHLNQANLIGADLTVADLSNASLVQADLSGAQLLAVSLDGADLTHASLIGAQLFAADLAFAKLGVAFLTRADLTHADLTYADLVGADLTDAHLNQANLTHANLRGAHLRGADLTGATFTDADLTGARLINNVNLSGATFTNATLDGAMWLASAQVPEGWQRDPDSYRLKRGNTSSDESAAN